MNVGPAEINLPAKKKLKDKELFGHPLGLYLLFGVEMWERFSYYGLRGLLTLFLTKAVMAGGLGFSDSAGVLIYGYFTGLVYLTPIIGGWIADNYIGQRTAILVGGITMMLGQFALAGGINIGPWLTTAQGMQSTGLDGVLQSLLTIIAVPGLFLIIIGNGFFKPNISTIVGALYVQGDGRRDSAFTIFYMGINLGAFIAPLVCGYFAEDLFAVQGVNEAGQRFVVSYGFKYGFLAAGLGMLLGQVMFNGLGTALLGDIGKVASAKMKTGDAMVADVPLTKEERDRLAVILTITIFVTFFWAGFEQAGSSLTLYTDKFINREVFGWLVPTSYFQSVNPLFIILLGLPIASLWTSLAKKGKDLSTPVKMSLGMILLGIGFLFMVGAVLERGGAGTDDTVKAGMYWLVLTYLFHTIGELCLSPIGLSMITRLAPLKLASMLMGVWFLSPFVAQILGGYIAQYVEELGPFKVFSYIAFFVIAAGIVLFLISRKLVTMMHGR